MSHQSQEEEATGSRPAAARSSSAPSPHVPTMMTTRAYDEGNGSSDDEELGGSQALWSSVRRMGRTDFLRTLTQHDNGTTRSKVSDQVATAAAAMAVSAKSGSSMMSTRSGLTFTGGAAEFSSDAAHENVFTWQDIRCSVKASQPPTTGDSGSSQQQQHDTGGSNSGGVFEILHGVSGSAHSSELVALVGPSGAGKSCFLDILAGRKTTGTVSGTRVFNGTTVSRDYMKAVSSYVTQEDSFHPTQTVLEAVMFQAQLRLDIAIPPKKKAYLARQLVQVAGLQSKEDRWIGGTLPGGIMVRGLSGGEKRRLSLCCGTINSPDLLFADEPTSGLDSLAALMIMKLLRGFCDRGMIVLSTIHQPRQAIWSLFDKVLVLAKGYCIFYGSPSDADHWFQAHLSFQRPTTTPASDFIMDQVNIDFDKSELYSQTTTRTLTTLADLKAAADMFRQHQPPPVALPAITLRGGGDGETDLIGKKHQERSGVVTGAGDHVKGSDGGSAAGKVPDFVFVAHSVYNTSFFSHLFPPSDTEAPYELQWWMHLLTPLLFFLFLLSPVVKCLGLPPRLITESWDFHRESREGEGETEPLRTQVWVTWYSGWQYLPSSPYLRHVREQINDIARFADRAGIKYMGLGALNKAEWVNHGGSDIKATVLPTVTKICHGNTMTAAAVCGNVIQIIEGKQLDHRVFITGATSKVGRAVALHLANRGFEVLCLTASQDRFSKMQADLPETAKGKLLATKDIKDGADVKVWIIGKFQPSANEHVPPGGEAVVFAVPDPMDQNSRPDINVTDGAIFELHPGTYSRRRNPLLLPARYLYACHTGCLVHAANGWEHDEIGEVDWTSLDRHLSAAYALKLRLPPLGRDHLVVRRRSPAWVTQYAVLLRRNFHSYTRSPGNVLARLVVVALIAVITGLVFLHLGRHSDSDAIRSLMGCLFWSCFVISLLPYASQSTFLYDRNFFQGENAAGLYSCSAYYLANVVLELLFNALNGAIFGLITYYCVQYQAFVHAESPAVSAVGFVGIIVLMNLVANAQVLFMTLASPNQEVAFVMAAAYTATSALTAGLFVSFPGIYRGIRWLQYLSMIKYPYQALLLHYFKGNGKAVVAPGVTAEDVLVKLQLNTPSTVGENVAVAVGIYALFIALGFLCLRFLYKEKR